MTSDLQSRAEAVLGYTFKNPQLLKESLTHASIAETRLHSNERMEFLGDAVLDLIICEALYLRFPEFLEGELTKIKSAVVSRRTCAEVSNETGLTDLLIIGKGISSRSSMPSSLAAAVYESIVAAIYLDGGFEVVKQYVLRTMTPKLEEIASNAHQQNFKAVLQQHAQKVIGATPMYELLDEKGPDHSKCFEICVCIEGRRFTSAWGPNKKMAEQKAALLALEDLGVLDEKEVDEAIDQMGDFVRDMHRKSGLLDHLAAGISLADAEEVLSALENRWEQEKASLEDEGELDVGHSPRRLSFGGDRERVEAELPLEPLV